MALIFDAKVALFEALKTAVPKGVFTTFASEGSSDRRQQVWLGATTDTDLEPTGMRDGPRKPTRTSGRIEVHALAILPGDPIGAERAVYVLREAIFDACIAVDRAAIPGLIDVRPESAEVDTAETTDGAYAALTVHVRVRGRII